MSYKPGKTKELLPPKEKTLSMKRHILAMNTKTKRSIIHYDLELTAIKAEIDPKPEVGKEAVNKATKYQSVLNDQGCTDLFKLFIFNHINSS